MACGACGFAPWPSIGPEAVARRARARGTRTPDFSCVLLRSCPSGSRTSAGPLAFVQLFANVCQGRWDDASSFARAVGAVTLCFVRGLPPTDPHCQSAAILRAKPCTCTPACASRPRQACAPRSSKQHSCKRALGDGSHSQRVGVHAGSAASAGAIIKCSAASGVCEAVHEWQCGHVTQRDST